MLQGRTGVLESTPAGAAGAGGRRLRADRGAAAVLRVPPLPRGGVCAVGGARASKRSRMIILRMMTVENDEYKNDDDNGDDVCSQESYECRY